MGARSCVNCGSPMGPDEHFCRVCGTPVAAAAGQPGGQPWGRPPAAYGSAPVSPGYPPPGYAVGQPAYPPAGYPAGWAPPGYAAQPASPYAGFWIRLVAYLVDAFLIGIVGWILTLPFQGWFSVETDINGMVTDWNIDRGKLQLWLLMNLVVLVLGAAYYVYSWARWGQTLGKKLLGLKVVDERGQLLSVGRCIGRYFSYIVSGIILYIGFLMIAWDRRKQGLHDKFVGSYVVKANPEPTQPSYPAPM